MHCVLPLPGDGFLFALRRGDRSQLLAVTPGTEPGPLFTTPTGVPNGVTVFQGTVTNSTAMALHATDLFLNFSGFSPDIDAIDQLLGFPDFALDVGATSPVVDLFRAHFASSAVPGQAYALDVFLEDVNGNESAPVTVTMLSVALAAFLVPETRAQTVRFSTGAPILSNIPERQLIVSLPITNTGAGEAKAVQVKRMTLATAVLVRPALPLALGDLAANGAATVTATFSSDTLAVNGTYLLAVQGTYELAGTVFGFALNRFITVPAVVPAPSAKDLAQAIVRAQTEEARADALLAIMRWLRIGVRQPTGLPVLVGEERSPSDFYLYDSELTLIATGLGRQLTYGIADTQGAETAKSGVVFGLQKAPRGSPRRKGPMWRDGSIPSRLRSIDSPYRKYL